jgi:hypothetical protein
VTNNKQQTTIKLPSDSQLRDKLYNQQQVTVPSNIQETTNYLVFVLNQNTTHNH